MNYVSNFSQQQISEIVHLYKDGYKDGYKDENIVENIALHMESNIKSILKILKYNKFDVEIIRSKQRRFNELREIPLNQIQKDLLIGTILGDSSLKDGSLHFSQCEKQFQMFFWKFAMFDPFMNAFNRRVDKRGNSIMLNASSIVHPDFKYCEKLFYSDKKRIPDSLGKLFSPISLAAWIMDDGNLNEGVNLRMCTMSFDKQDHDILQSVLKDNFGLDSKVQDFKYRNKTYNQLVFNKLNTKKISDIVRPYIVEDMLYKIMPESSETLCLGSFGKTIKMKKIKSEPNSKIGNQLEIA